MIGEQKKKEPAIHEGCLHGSTISMVMVAPVPLVLLKALDRFILETLNAFCDTFSYQVRYPLIPINHKCICLRAEASARNRVLNILSMVSVKT